MDADWRKRTQITLLILMVLAAARVGIIFYERSHEPEVQKPKPPLASSYKITLDDYVTPHKLFPFDLKSAREEVAGKTLWMRAGNQVAFYPYSSINRAIDPVRKAGVLAPLEKLQIKEVIAQSIHGQKQIVTIFTRQGATAEYGVAVAKMSQGSYDFFINDLFFSDDPHQLYNHWPAEIWDAIDHHQVKNGMNELQASFALGTNIRATAGDYGNRSVQYIDGDHSTMVSFSDNKAVSVEPGPRP